jgi:DNA-binding NarL/FixJ family response regulator
MFLDIVASADRWFPPSVDALGVQSQPNNIKVLSVLRYLATGVAAQYTAEASGLSPKTISGYLPLFLQKFVAEYGVYLFKFILQLFIFTYHS